MAHTLHALIGGVDVLRAGTGALSAAHVVDLAQGLALLPIGAQLFNELDRDCEGNDPYAEFWYLSICIAALAEHLAQQTPVAYVETEYFGGVGSQAAIVWDKGEVVFGPAYASNEPEFDRACSAPLSDHPINSALRVLGVVADAGRDEFDTLGLGRQG